MSICIFGDSVAWGAFDEEDDGWVARLNKGFKYHIYNLGINGEGTTELLKRLDQEARTREADVILIASGDADSAYIGEPSNMRVPLDKFKDNIRQLMQRAKSITDKVAFIGFIPIDESKTMPLPWEPHYCHTLENCGKYNNTIKEICNEHNVAFIDVFNALVKTDYSGLLEDGVHPNSKGHEEMAKIIRAFLEQKGWLNEDW